MIQNFNITCQDTFSNYPYLFQGMAGNPGQPGTPGVMGPVVSTLTVDSTDVFFPTILRNKMYIYKYVKTLKELCSFGFHYNSET